MDEWDNMAAELLRWLENADETWHERFQAVAAAALRQAAAKGREQAALIADKRAAICRAAADAYKAEGREFAETSERCAGIEAAHIAELIRSEEG